MNNQITSNRLNQNQAVTSRPRRAINQNRQNQAVTRRSQINQNQNQALTTTTSRRSRNGRALWTDPQIQLLIRERRRRNFEYHYLIPERSRVGIWEEIASTINAAFHTNYVGTQCMNKFNSLVLDYYVSKIYSDIVYCNFY